MSMINKVLQEIEKNKGGKPSNTPSVTLELGTSFSKHQRKFFNPFTLIGLIVLVLAIAIFYAHPHYGKIISATTPPTKAAATATTTKNTQENTQLKANTSIKEAIVNLNSVTVDTSNNKTIVNFNLSQTTYYYVEHGKDQTQLKLILSSTTYDNAFDLNLIHTAIKNIIFRKVNSNVEIDIELLPDSQIIGLQLSNQPKPQLQLSLLNTSVPIGTVSKNMIPLTSDEKADQDYMDALDLLDKNKTDLAINKLHSVVKNSKNPECYELLANLLIRNNSYNEANKILTSAITKFPDYVNYYQLKAYIFMQHGNNAQALAELLKKPPEITQNPEYYALIANIYQQQNQYLLAAKLYNRLVQIRPDRSIWWVGLGIALESANEQNAAEEAYKKAQSLGDLSTELKTFVNSKFNK